MSGKRPTIAAVQRAVAEAFELPVRVMTSDELARSIARPRQAAMALAYSLTGRSGPVIARHFGGRDPTTVVYARRAVAARREADEDLDRRLRRLERQLASGGDPEMEACARRELQLALFHGPLFDLAGEAAHV